MHTCLHINTCKYWFAIDWPRWPCCRTDLPHLCSRKHYAIHTYCTQIYVQSHGGEKSPHACILTQNSMHLHIMEICLPLQVLVHSFTQHPVYTLVHKMHSHTSCRWTPAQNTHSIQRSLEALNAHLMPEIIFTCYDMTDMVRWQQIKHCHLGSLHVVLLHVMAANLMIIANELVFCSQVNLLFF